MDNMKKKAWIISNGDIQNYNFYKNMISKEHLIICADGGAVHASNMNIIPDVLIGDMDSIPYDDYNKKFKDIEIIKYSTDKDETDTQLAVEYAIKKRCNEIILIGCLGSRFDHSFANISLLKLIIDNGIKGMILNEHNEIFFVNKHIKLNGNKGQTISILPVSDKISGITTRGLKYQLHDDEMVFATPRGVSNVFADTQAEITLKDGLALVIKIRGDV